MSLGDNYEDAALNAVLGATHHSSFPATMYFAFYDDSDPPSDAGGGTENTALGRVAVPNNGSMWPAASGSQKTNGQDITGFNTVGSDQPTAGWWGLHGDATADDLVIWGQLSEVVTVYAGESAEMPAGAITVTAD